MEASKHKHKHHKYNIYDNNDIDKNSNNNNNNEYFMTTINKILATTRIGTITTTWNNINNYIISRKNYKTYNRGEG